ncbi:hypothetical protein RFI_00013 [Reticulomyxa filosa]|uniref:Sugar transporter SWEET1 n=1 Tax=Reticulomyxa filosa TaxID=46433 RepID=X6PEX9_RETFI|nr:hypothetical protein RFI_00013 [Reticulomyxa filosa]|eukprot:ETO37050.1 hypothetical protein RFI_00013 [Reticulomyxa filosa]
MTIIGSLMKGLGKEEEENKKICPFFGIICLYRNLRSIKQDIFEKVLEIQMKSICRISPNGLNVSRYLVHTPFIPCLKAKSSSVKRETSKTAKKKGEKKRIKNGIDNDSTKSSTSSSLSNISVATAVAGSASGYSAMITTKAGYTLSSLSVSTLSNIPLFAFMLVQASGLSPILHILREKKTFNYSPFPFVALFTNSYLWTFYGYLTNDNTLLYASVAGKRTFFCAFAGLVYMSIFHKYTSMKMLPYYVGSFSIMSACFGASFFMLHNDPQSTSAVLDVLGLVGSVTSVTLMASPLACIQQVLQDKNTNSMPFPISLAMTFNGFSWFCYGWFVTGDPFIYAPSGLGLLAGMAQLSLFVIYPSSKKNFLDKIDK